MKINNTHPSKSPRSGFRKLTAFTLVELIVVISILAILGTIGLISFSGYQGSARDSVRVSDIKSIQKGLSIFQIKTGFYPLPEDSIEIMAGVSLLSYQGYVWDGISRIVNTNKTPLDPKDTTRYIYTIDSTKKKAQLMGYMESGDTIKVTAYNDLFSRLVNQSYAAATSNVDYKKRVVYVIGDTIGVLTDGDKAPIQESTTWTGINLSSVDTTGYVAYFGWDIYGTWQSTGTGDVLIAQMLWAQTNTIPCNPLSYSGYTITALAHNQTQTFTKPLTIANGSGTGSLQIQCQNGTLDTTHAIETSNIGCNTNYVNQAGSCIQDLCGGTVPTSAHSTASSQSVSQNWTRNAIPGVCTFDCDTNYTWNGTSCIANTQSMSCTWLPSNGVWNTVSSITQIWNGSSWTPSTTGAYNTTASTTSCNYACSTGFHTENAWVSCTANTQSCAIANGNGSQTWNTGTSAWNTCTVVSCNTGFTVSGNSCITNAYTISGSFWANANGATVSVCGTNVTADASGNFTTTKTSGSVCNNIAATRAGYTCTTTTNGPASLTSNFTTAAGSCTAILPVAPTTTGNIRCGNGTITINATPPTWSTIDWYTVATGGSPVAIGINTYTPTISITTTYYAESRNTITNARSATRTTAIAQVDAQTVGGTIQASQNPVWPGTSITLGVSGYLGTIQQWERSYAPSPGWMIWSIGTPINFVWATDPQYSFRALIKNGICPAVYSSQIYIYSYEDNSYCSSPYYTDQGLCEGDGYQWYSSTYNY